MKFEIPAAILGQHIAVLGKTGSGKTSTEKLIIEEVVEHGFRVCVLDTVKSDWWGITSSASGKHAGLPFKILGGPHGHVPLHSSAGKVIGQLVGSGKLPLSIIDMSDFEAGGIQKFFTDFAPSLMRNAKGVVYLVIEEAHELAPKERAGFGSENLAIHWAKKMATAGRSKGIRLIVATQRVQALHNAVLGSCETVIAHRLTTPADQEPVVKWLRSNTTKETADTVAESLSSLPTGTGWLCSGEAKCFEKIAFPKFKTYDNTATPTGDSQEISIKTAEVDQVELGNLIGVAVEEAKANDPAEMKRTISDLKRKLADAERRPEAKQSEPEKVSILDDAAKALLLKVEHACTAAVSEHETRLVQLQGLSSELNALRVQITASTSKAPIRNLTMVKQSVQRSIQLPRAERFYREKTITARVESNGDVSKCEAAILGALDAHGDCTIGRLALLSGYAQSGSFKNALSSLRTRGLITGENQGTMSITNDGAAHGPFPKPPTTPDDRIAYWMAFPHFGKCDREIIQVLWDAGKALTMAQIAEAANYEVPVSGSFKNSLSNLRTTGVIVGRNQDAMSLNPTLFE